GGERLRAAYTGVTRPYLSQSRDAPPGPAVVPVSMMPEAARERTVSFRARAPHSLRFREYPRPKASFTERDSVVVSDFVTNVKSDVTVAMTSAIATRLHALPALVEERLDRREQIGTIGLHHDAVRPLREFNQALAGRIHQQRK